MKEFGVMCMAFAMAFVQRQQWLRLRGFKRLVGNSIGTPRSGPGLEGEAGV